MSWSSLVSNQWVSYSNLQNAVDTGVLDAISTFPSTDRWINKSDLISYVGVDIANPYLSAKSSNQWVAVRDITPIKFCPVSNYRLANSGPGGDIVSPNPYTYSGNSYLGTTLWVDVGTISGVITISYSIDYFYDPSAAYSFHIYYPDGTINTVYNQSGTFGYISGTGSATVTVNYVYNASYGSKIGISIIKIL
jgi:hypothetical protein